MIALALAAQLSVVANAPDTATVCTPVELTAAARVAGRTAPRLSLAGSPLVQLLERTDVSRTEHTAAGEVTITESVFRVALRVPGRLSLPPVVATAGSLRTSAALPAVDVRASGAAPPLVLVRADVARRVPRDGPVFVGEQVDYVVDVQLNEGARQRLRRNPVFFPPEIAGVLAYDVTPPGTVEREGRRCFETLSYRRALFPLYPGETSIPPASLTYALPLSSSFFAREENVTRTSNAVSFMVRDAPARGRPAAFAGAVGRLTATARVERRPPRMGDPLVFTVRVEGTGNVKLWPRPALAIDWGTLAPTAERVAVDTASAAVRGAKEFDWLLTPRQAGARMLPPVGYTYFDPERAAYDSVRTAPIALDVAAAVLAATDTLPVARDSIRRTLLGERPPPPSSRVLFWIALAMAPVPAAARRMRARAGRRRATESASAALVRAARGTTPADAGELRRLLLAALGARVPAVRGAASVERALLRSGVTHATATAVGALLDQLAAAAYARGPLPPGEAAGIAVSLARDVDREAVRGSAARSVGAATSAAIVGLLLGTPMLAASIATAREDFSAGVRAYDAAQLPTARRSFARAVTAAPRSLESWANLGTSAWAQGDTAAAARAWQRALRVDPTDRTLRGQLGRVQSPSLAARGSVAPLPPGIVAGAALGAWLIGWLVLAVPPARRGGGITGLARGAAVAGGIGLLLALEVADRLQPAGLGVLRTSRELRDAPSPAGGAAALGNAGETGRIGAREGEWVRVELERGRAGWVPASTLLLLDAPVTD